MASLATKLDAVRRCSSGRSAGRGGEVAGPVDPSRRRCPRRRARIASHIRYRTAAQEGGVNQTAAGPVELDHESVRSTAVVETRVEGAGVVGKSLEWVSPVT